MLVRTYLRLRRSNAGIRSGRGRVISQIVHGWGSGAAAGRRVALRVESGEHHFSERSIQTN